jgi:type II secretory pathway component PulF
MPRPITLPRARSRVTPVAIACLAFALGITLASRVLPEATQFMLEIGVGLPLSTRALLRAAAVVDFILVPSVIAVVFTAGLSRLRVNGGQGVAARLTRRGNALPPRVIRFVETTLLVFFASAVALITAALLGMADAMRRA